MMKDKSWENMQSGRYRKGSGTGPHSDNGKKVSTYRRKLAAGVLCLSASFLLGTAANRVPGMAQWYTEHIYSGIVSVVGRLFGVFSFSCFEVLCGFALIVFMGTFLQMLWRIFRKKAGKAAAANWFSSVFLAVGILFLVYTLNCGINYHRDSFAEYAGLAFGNYTVEDLRQICLMLTEDVNRFGGEVKRENGLMVLTGDYREEAVQAMRDLSETYPVLSGYYSAPKPLLFSEILSLQSLSGIYSPFTIEANYNQDMTAYNIPFTICHELSHLRGFMQEEEANFIAYLACLESGSPQFQYSGSLLAWIHCSNALQRYDENSWREIRAMLQPEVLTDLKANSEFWDIYEGEIAEIAEQVNDTYLQANGQADGTGSYNRMVDLLVAYLAKDDAGLKN